MSVENCTYWILCGVNRFSIVNSIWASIDKKKIIPSEIVLLFSDKELISDKIKNSIQAFVDEFLDGQCKINSGIISEWEIKKNIDMLVDLVMEKSDNKKTLVIDITPGRKTMSISGVLFAIKILRRKEQFKNITLQHIIYWHLRDSEKYQNKWYSEIPRTNFNCVDLMDVFQ